MKKTFISLAIISFLIGAITYSTASYYTQKDQSLIRAKVNDLPSGYDSVSIAGLYQVGFRNTKAANSIDAYNQRKIYKEKYGLSFLSNDEMADFLKKNNFILGNADKYIGEIPGEAVKCILTNIKKLTDPGSVYTLTLTHDNLNYELLSQDLFIGFTGSRTSISWDEVLFNTKNSLKDYIKPSAIQKYNIKMSDFWVINIKKPEDNKIMVVGGAKEFNISGMQIVEGILSLPVPKDPIAVQKVQGGYVELANWQ